MISRPSDKVCGMANHSSPSCQVHNHLPGHIEWEGELVRHDPMDHNKQLKSGKIFHCRFIKGGALCGTSWKTNCDLVRHEVSTHLGDGGLKKFECFCGKKFKQKSHLETHMNQHAATKPYGCSCGKQFSDRSSMARHTKRDEISHIWIQGKPGSRNGGQTTAAPTVAPPAPPPPPPPPPAQQLPLFNPWEIFPWEGFPTPSHEDIASMFQIWQQWLGQGRVWDAQTVRTMWCRVWGARGWLWCDLNGCAVYVGDGEEIALEF
jgi:hypothetical protein